MYKNHSKNIKDINKSLTKEEKKLIKNFYQKYNTPLIIKSYNHDPKTKLIDFISKMIILLNSYDTLYKKNKNYYCGICYYRTIKDFYLISKSYYPNLTLVTFLYHLLNNPNYNLTRGLYCSTPKDITFNIKKSKNTDLEKINNVGVFSKKYNDFTVNYRYDNQLLYDKLCSIKNPYDFNVDFFHKFKKI